MAHERGQSFLAPGSSALDSDADPTPTLLGLSTCPEPFRPKGPRRYALASESDGDSESGDGGGDEEDEKER